MNPLESSPTQEQRLRLEDWLTELLIICRRYDIMVDTLGPQVAIIDLLAGTTIGVELQFLLGGAGKVSSCEVVDSILDGVWLIDVDGAQVEQRSVGSIYPSREGPISDRR